MLKTQIQEDLKTAMRAKDTIRLGAVRMLIAEMKKTEIDKQITLDDEGILSLIQKMIKQRQDAFTQFADAGRDDLAQKEKQEMDILGAYLPAQMSEAEVEAAVKAAIGAAGANSMQDMGKVMATLKADLAGKADMRLVSAKVKSLLS